MYPFSCIPPEIRKSLEGLRHQFRAKHLLTLSWLVFLHIICFETANLKTLHKHASNIEYKRLLQFLRAKYLRPQLWLKWLAMRLIDTLPHEDLHLKILVDTTFRLKCSVRNPGISRGKNRTKGPWLEGLHIMLVCFQWHNFRVPVAFALLRKKSDPEYRKPNQVLLDLLSEIEIPAWAKQVTFLGDAAFASKKVFRRLEKWGWNYVVRLPKTWKLSDGRHVKEIAENLERKAFQRTWFTPAHSQRRRTCYVYMMKASLHELGNVTLLFSKTVRQNGPTSVRILVTNASSNASQTLALYQRRWYIEVLFRELKSGMGLGAHQVNTAFHQIENSIGVSLLAYTLLLKLKADSIPKDKSWSIFDLKNQFLNECMQQKLLSFESVRSRKAHYRALLSRLSA